MDLNQPFVSCSACHANPQNQRTQELYLTSCAHIVCREHATKGTIETLYHPIKTEF